ncbi:unnamed protein product [Colias eurytheme]|nr:unnamed protein product [Colias eurytheme]
MVLNFQKYQQRQNSSGHLLLGRQVSDGENRRKLQWKSVSVSSGSEVSIRGVWGRACGAGRSVRQRCGQRRLGGACRVRSGGQGQALRPFSSEHVPECKYSTRSTRYAVPPNSPSINGPFDCLLRAYGAKAIGACERDGCFTPIVSPDLQRATNTQPDRERNCSENAPSCVINATALLKNGLLPLSESNKSQTNFKANGARIACTIIETDYNAAPLFASENASSDVWSAGGGGGTAACGSSGMDLKHEVAYRGLPSQVKAEPGVSHNGHPVNGHVRDWMAGGGGSPSPGAAQPQPNGYSSPLSSSSYGPYSPNGKIGILLT